MMRTRAPVFLAFALVLALAGAAQATVVSGIQMKVTGLPTGSVGPYRLDVNPDPVTGIHQYFDLLPCINEQTSVWVNASWTATAYSADDAALDGSGLEILGSGGKSITEATAWKDWWLSRQIGKWVTASTSYGANGLSLFSGSGPDLAGVHSGIWELGGGAGGYTVPGSASTYGTTAYWVSQADTAYYLRTTFQADDYAKDLQNIWVLRSDVSGYQPFLLANGKYDYKEDVPEPSTWALLLMGVAMTAFTLKKRQAAA